MSVQTLSSDNRLKLANALLNASVAVRQNVESRPVNYVADVDATLAKAKALLDAAVAG